MAEGITSRSTGYNALDRLAGASFSCDPLDNPQASVVGGRNSTHTYDCNNRRSSISNGAGNTGHLYDAQGNVNQRGAQAYSFDIANRMSAATNKASYSYDGLGRRICSVQSDGTTRTFVYSQAGQLTPRLALCPSASI